MKYYLTTLLFCLFFIQVNAQKPTLLSGPVIGSVTTNSAKIWIAYKGKSDNVIALFDAKNKEVKFPTNLDYIKNKKDVIAMTLSFTGLRENTEYIITVKFNDQIMSDSYKLTTLSKAPIKDFSFIAGSCFLEWPNGFGKMFFPGAHKRIFEPMIRDTSADFNLWMGDNTYLLFGQWNSFEKNFKRQLKTRTTNKLYSKYLMSRHNYAIWDDHDFGPNDCNGNFALKDTSLKIFTHFWPNESFGIPGTKGIFSSFKQYDCEFFLLDDRYYRSDEDDSTGKLLGDEQMQWLKLNLLQSKATFKFIVTGSQVLNKQTEKECWMSDYPADTKDFLSFIDNNNITGLMFLTGDRHLTRVIKDTSFTNYPLYDFTISPVLSILTKETEIEINNPLVVPGTLVQGKRNYATIEVKGEVNQRKCIIKDFDEYGVKQWEIEIGEEDLR